MKLRTRYLKLLVVLILLFCFGIDSFGQQEKPVRISPIQIKWNAEIQKFHAYFDVTNDTEKNVDLTSIIIFKVGRFKRWRGTRLPGVKAHQTDSFKMSFSPGIMLKNEYFSITVNIYGKDYVGLIDYSSRHINISSRRMIDEEGTKIELTETAPLSLAELEQKKAELIRQLEGREEEEEAPGNEPEDESPETAASAPPVADAAKAQPAPAVGKTAITAIAKKTLIIIGPAKKRMQLLATEQFQNASLEKISPEERKQLAVAKPPPAPPAAPGNLGITPGKHQNRLEWQPVKGVSSYNLYWSTTAGVTPKIGRKIENISSGYVHDGLEEAIPYFYVVTAVRDGFESDPSNEVSAQPILPPKNVPVLTVTAGDGELELSWTTIPDATAYHLYWGTKKDLRPSQVQRMVLQGSTFQHTDLTNDQTYYYTIAAVNQDGEGALSQVTTGTPVRLEATVAELLEGVQLDEFQSINTDPTLLVPISDIALEREASLKRAEELKELDISSRDQLISLYIAEGKSESVAKVLSSQLSREPENLNLSLSLSKVYHEQGDIKAALKVLNSSLNRISLSARIALNQELKTSVRKGESTLTTKSEEAYLADEFSRLGISLLEKRKYVEALSAFQSLYSLSQDYPMVKYYLGLSRQGMKQYNQAKQLFVEQATVDLQKKQLMDDLEALTLVLAVTLDIPTIKDTRSQYVKIQQGQNTPEEAQTIVKQIATLDALLAEAEKRRLAGLPDLSIALVDDFSKDVFQPGQKIKFAFATTNIGKKKSEPYRVYYQLKHAQGITFDIPGFDRFKGLKAEKDTYSWKKEILIPAIVVPGKYQLIANVEQTGGKGEVTFDNNRVQSAPGITITQPVPDLEIRFAEKLPSTTIKTGMTIDLSLVVTNIGFKNSPSFEVDYFLESEDGELTNLKVSDKHNSIQKGNKSTRWKKQLPISIELEEGQYQFVAKIRLAEKAIEQNDSNNSVATGFNLDYSPPFTDVSLQFAQGLPEETVSAGQTFSIQLTVENSGNSSSSPGSITYRLLNKDDDTISLKEKSRVPSLQKDQDPATITQVFQLPEKLAGGNYKLIASLELDDNDHERNEKDNRVTSDSQITVKSAFSDLLLVLETGNREQPVIPGDTITVKTRLKNNGNWKVNDITIEYMFNSRSGKEVKIEEKGRVALLEAGSEQTLEKQIRIPESFTEGIYRITAAAEIDNDDFEKNNANNADQSDYLFSYLKSEPVEDPTLLAEQQEKTLETVEETEEQKVTRWTRHAAAISLAAGGTWMALSENKKYQDAQDEEDDLESQYNSSQSASEVSVIDSKLENNRSQMELYAQNTNLWTALAIVGISWEVYNIFLWEPGQSTINSSDDGFQLNNKWAHASAIGIATIALWQSQNEVQKAEDLSDENDDLEADYRNASTAAEVASIRNKISSNETKMANHINNANIFDGITLAALGFESYLLWKAFTDPDSSIVELRYQNSDGFQLKPCFAYEKVGLNLKYNW